MASSRTGRRGDLVAHARLRSFAAAAVAYVACASAAENPAARIEFLDRAFDSVSINASQNNPFQPDVNFRGFSASPLLGTPQGLSVFTDGVRVNEAFGDVVNWDLIPRNAISSI